MLQASWLIIGEFDLEKPTKIVNNFKLKDCELNKVIIMNNQSGIIYKLFNISSLCESLRYHQTLRKQSFKCNYTK